jgi:hypothetical protein
MGWGGGPKPPKPQSPIPNPHYVYFRIIILNYYI